MPWQEIRDFLTIKEQAKKTNYFILINLKKLYSKFENKADKKINSLKIELLLPDEVVFEPNQYSSIAINNIKSEDDLILSWQVKTSLKKGELKGLRTIVEYD